MHCSHVITNVLFFLKLSGIQSGKQITLALSTRGRLIQGTVDAAVERQCKGKKWIVG